MLITKLSSIAFVPLTSGTSGCAAAVGGAGEGGGARVPPPLPQPHSRFVFHGVFHTASVSPCSRDAMQVAHRVCE